MNHNIIEKSNIIVNSSAVAYISVINENGYPSVSTISSVKTDGMYTAYFATGLNTNKAKRLIENNKSSVCYRKDGDNVTLVGQSEIIVDQNVKNDLWQDWFINHFPLGKADPNYCIIKFTTNRVSLWIEKESAEFGIDEAQTVQSRCGLMCSSCTFKEPCNCGGCIETRGQPFYGECPIAVCCQNKNHTHCGECADMPCEPLYQYSCGDIEHGDKPSGARLSVLRKWSTKPFYKCSIVEESLENKDILAKIQRYKFIERISKTDDAVYPEWHIGGYIFSQELLLEVMDELKDFILPDWYIHAFNEKEGILYVVLKGKTFMLSSKKGDEWEEMIAYGESVGIGRKWTENIPMSV